MKRSLSLFATGTVAGLAALGFNFMLRLGGIAAFPPESALSAFLRVVPAYIEEPMVQRFADFAGPLGLIVITLIAAAVYGAIFVVYDRFAAAKVARFGLSTLETVLVMSLIPWILFGLVLFPVDGNAVFGMGPFASPSSVWIFPLGLLLAQAVFALLASVRYHLSSATSIAVLPDRPKQNLQRRDFIEKGIIGILAVAGVAVGVTGLGQLFPPEPVEVSQPINLAEAPAIFSDPRLATLVDSEVTPAADFYRVAIDIIDPTVGASIWSLGVDGLVNSPKSYSIEDIQSFPETTQYTALECISNELNGDLISNAMWGGVKISDILANAGGVQPGAGYVVFYSVDGYSVGIPLEKAMMPHSILAYSMNGETLPARHGYPLRGVIPGLYGMMSAKWVTRISVMGSAYDGYWQTRGWTNDATVYTEVFIVLPSATVELSQSEGSIMVAGFAYAGDRGISKVEVSFDNGRTWEQATLKPPLSNLTWVLWAYEWILPPLYRAGEYIVIARATDGNGQLQTSAEAGTYPNGATGYVSLLIQITD